MIRIKQRINADVEYLQQAGYEVLGVFLYGSQNYQVNTKTSDIDTKAIVIPSLSQTILRASEIKMTITRENGELTVFDLQSMHQSIKKQNINFLEILFTEYKWINPKYADIYNEMIIYREEIARLNPSLGVSCIYGCFSNKYNKIFKKVPSNIESIEVRGYDSKAYADATRLVEFLRRFIEGDKYADCLIPVDKEAILALKTAQPRLNVAKVRANAELLYEEAASLLNNYLATDTEAVDFAALQLVDKVTVECCKRYYFGEIKCNS